MQDAGKEDYLRPSVHIGLDWIVYEDVEQRWVYESMEVE